MFRECVLIRLDRDCNGYAALEFSLIVFSKGYVISFGKQIQIIICRATSRDGFVSKYGSRCLLATCAVNLALFKW